MDGDSVKSSGDPIGTYADVIYRHPLSSGGNVAFKYRICEKDSRTQDNLEQRTCYL